MSIARSVLNQVPVSSVLDISLQFTVKVTEDDDAVHRFQLFVVGQKLVRLWDDVF